MALPSLGRVTTAVATAAVNVHDLVRGGGRIADLRPMPSSVLADGPQRTLYRYAGGDPSKPPILLVPPLAAPALCFDLRRGCSLVEHLVGLGYRTYLVDYGPIAFGDRNLGVEHWIDGVLPESIRDVAADAGAPVNLIGWSLGGILALLVAADSPDLPLASVTMVGSPFDFTQVPLVAPLRPLVHLTGGRLLTTVYRALGGAPAPIVQRTFQLISVDTYLTKPLAIARNIEDRDFLAQIEAVDRFMGRMQAYPGRTFGQLYHRFFRANDLADGTLDLGGREIVLAKVTVPVLSIAGEGDGIAPRAAVHHIADLVPQAQLATAPGGHLGVLTGRAARHTTWPRIDAFLTRCGGGPPRKRRTTKR